MMVDMGFPSGGEANQGWKLYLTSLIMVLSAGLVVVTRIITRFWTGKLGADDYTIVASLAFSIVLSINIQLAVVYGYGKHKRHLSPEELRTCLKFFWIAQTPYKIVVCLNKTSVIILYKRIFISKHFPWLCYSALAIVISSSIAATFSTIFQCVPLERSWNKAIDGTCIDSSKFWLANAALNISTDVVVLALPIREIFELHLELQEKLMLCGVFLLGGFVTMTSILRVTAVANSVHNQQDQTWTFIPRGIWTLIEANLGIICTCLPVLKQLVRRVFPLIFNPSKMAPRGAHGHRGSSSRGASHLNRSIERKHPAHDHQQHYNLDDTIDHDTQTNFYMQKRKTGRGMRASGKSYEMKSLVGLGESDHGRRKSDEKHIMATNGVDQDDGQSSKEKVNMVNG
ncbi:hypothetical protein K504DRAFT_534161 [Pleomassaria siparia CBS 279.74]|uniref:Rhodopsin domain-containing protein n=1 Tax=Pleomassaria siparia CBS 279.74 TaxID=1314801 RepID=A0A6G1K6M8_9PLEO|nr:hypothetical protein K504DRAFT_534161 [Pleomassaria siparia CBS 279.74]